MNVENRAEVSSLPAVRSGSGGDVFDMAGWADELVARARSQGIELAGENGLLTAMVRQVLQTGLNVELAEHVGYQPYAVEGRGSGNNRNGSYPKTVITDVGPVEVQMPRDRMGTFEPVTIPKHVRRLDGLTGNVISLYAKGMTTGDIQQHLVEIYGTEISRETISKITDSIVEDMLGWQNRPLDSAWLPVFVANQRVLVCGIHRCMSWHGVRSSRQRRGRSLSSAATRARCSSLNWSRSQPLGKYCRNSPLVFSLVPRCHGECGSAK